MNLLVHARPPAGPSRSAWVLTALTLIFPAALPPWGTAAPVPDFAPPEEGPRAEVRLPAPTRYALVLQAPGPVRSLYGPGDVIFHPQDPTRALRVVRVEAEALIVREGPGVRPQLLRVGSPIPGFPGLTLLGTVLLEAVQYRYKIVDTLRHPDPVLVALEGPHAILEVETLSAGRPAAGGPPPTTPRSAFQPPPRTTLDANLLEQVRVRQFGPNLYQMPAADVRAVLDNVGRVLADLSPLVLPSLNQGGFGYQIISAASDGVLTGKGFLVTSPKLAGRAGIEVGDVILSVNGIPVNGFASLYGIYRQVRRDPNLTTVQLELERRASRLTKTYRIR